MYTIKTVTNKGTYLFEGKNIRYQTVICTEDLDSPEARKGRSIVDPDKLRHYVRLGTGMELTKDSSVMEIEYVDAEDDIQKYFYLTAGSVYFIQKGKTVDQIHVNFE